MTIAGILRRSSFRSGRTTIARLVLVVTLAACNVGTTSSSSASSPGPNASIAPGSSGAGATETVPVSPVEGIVLTIDSEGLTKVHGFTLRTKDGLVLTFTIGALENGTQFPPGHLGEHQASAQPVRVYFRQEGGALVVYRLEDAS